MPDKIKIVFSFIAYPMAIARFFERALERRDDVELFTVGPYTRNYIPWGGGMDLPMKYAKAPDLPLPSSSMGRVPWPLIKGNLPWEPDLILEVDAGFYIFPKPDVGIVAHVATDPHALGYDAQRSYADFFFNMQTPYMKDGDIYLPYAYDPTLHYPMNIEKDYDAVLLGLHYPNRTEWVRRLESVGYKVYYDLGPVFDEYREICNRGKVGLNWSSRRDLVCRVWELMAMRVPVVTNHVPDMNQFFEDQVDYVGFDTMDEAVLATKALLNNREYRESVAEQGYQVVTNGGHTWDDRVQFILERAGLL